MANEETIDISPDPKSTYIPWGQYKRSTISSLSNSYLSYLMDDIDSLIERDPWLGSAIKQEWNNRK